MNYLIFYFIFSLAWAFAYSECPHIFTKDEWGGVLPLRVKYVLRPVDLVIIKNTESPTCTTKEQCDELVKIMQKWHMEYLENPDLAVSFLIGGNGNIYEGSGWLHVGNHTPGYNDKSIAISFMGNFDVNEPTQESMRAAQALIQCGVDEEHLLPDYKLVGHKQLLATGGPGEKLYKEVITWPHWTQDVSSNMVVSPLGSHTVKLGDSWVQVKESLSAVVEKPTSKSPAIVSDKCILPSYPNHGTYVVLGNITASPGQALKITAMRYSCELGYQLVPSDNVVVCHEGVWYNKTPMCKRLCHLERHPGVEYQCLIDKYENTTGHRKCAQDEPEGTVIRPLCKEPSFYSPIPLKSMICVDGIWDSYPNCTSGLCHLERHPGVEYLCLIDEHTINTHTIGQRKCAQYEPEGTVIRPLCKEPSFYSPIPLKSMTCVYGIWDSYPNCTSECGTIPTKGTSLVFDDAYSNILENNLPWHTMIYRNTKNPYIFICGGSLVTDSVIISAAQCFWRQIEKILPASEFAVAVEKSHLEWDDPKDTRAQKSDIREIKIPGQFQGPATKFKDNIALIFVNRPFQFSMNVRPVCLDLDYAFDKHRLESGHFGKLSRWAFKDDNSESSPALEVVDMAYLDIEKCKALSSLAYAEMLTSDKFCTSYMNDTATVIKGYSGSGLAFPENEQGIQRYYLRGVAHTALRSDLDANSFIISFTRISLHEHFITKNIK